MRIVVLFRHPPRIAGKGVPRSRSSSARGALLAPAPTHDEPPPPPREAGPQHPPAGVVGPLAGRQRAPAPLDGAGCERLLEGRQRGLEGVGPPWLSPHRKLPA